MSRGKGVNLHAMPTWRIIQALQEERGCKLIDPAELINVTLDRLIQEGKKIMVVS